MDVEFSNKLERIEESALWNCASLERITIPLKDGIIEDDAVFQGCYNLMHFDLVDGVVLREIIAALQLKGWRNDMNEEINAIKHILPSAAAAWGGNASVIRGWIRSVLGKIIHYKADHRHLLTEAASIIPIALPEDIVMNNVLPFLELPSYTFDGEDHR